MLSLDLLRRAPDQVKAGLQARGEPCDSVDEVLALDAQRRQTVTERDRLRAQHNEVSRRMGQALARARREPGAAAEADALREEAKALSQRIEALDEQARRLEEQIEALLLTLPNLPRPDVPIGADASGNRIVRTWGEPNSFPFPPLPHWELGERLGILDTEQGAKLAGSRFFVLKGLGARLQRALISWFLDVHTREHGYTEIYLPYLVRSPVLVGAGVLPKFGDNIYRDAEEDLWLIPTAEVPLTSLYAGDILPPGSLPQYWVAHSPCFRREKAAAGRDVRGIKRVHQFEKVECYKFCEPSASDAELERLVADVEDLLQRLGLAYRVVLLCTGDLGFQSAKTYDLEVWAPGSGEWLEVSSCSTCTDFQARRANIRYRPAEGARPEYVHTLNGSGLALPRTIAAILETYQQEDGSVLVPEVLRPYMGVERITGVKERA
ncbi:MAG: serine--tRNA ligase [Dehalococcoidia bacterium]|nr:serine--tRNA ligase [Dehalococcoidia bacterium]MDW8120565.1 serine--tRNA ligase [Chloroflexota bacterium]